MSDDRRLPVLVGVGDVRGGGDHGPEAAREPLELAERAARRAADDAGAPALLREIDTVRAVRTSSWAYDDLPGALAARLGADPPRRATTTVGGHWPAALVDEAAAATALGDSRITLLVGAEAQAAVSALTRAGLDPGADRGWTRAPGGPPRFEPDELGSPAMRDAGLVLPTRVYPLFEAALRHRLGRSPREATAESARMYAAFSEVAVTNPVAWRPRARGAEEIAPVGPANRMVCEPYPLAMNAMPHVDQAAAVLVTSLATARAFGVPDDAVVHVWGGAGACEEPDVLARADFARSPALESALRRGLDRAGLGAAEIDVLDAYTCFPVVPKLVLDALGLGVDHPATATGGHSSFGGPLSSYSLHGAVSVVRRLRAGAAVGLLHANGGYLTTQHAVLLGARAHPDGYVGDPVPAPVTGSDTPAPARAGFADGVVTVETATVEYGRDGAPAQGFLVARTGDGARVVAQTEPGDEVSARSLSVAAGAEVVGRRLKATVAGPFARLAVLR